MLKWRAFFRCMSAKLKDTFILTSNFTCIARFCLAIFFYFCNMVIFTESFDKKILLELQTHYFGDMVKGVVDIVERKIALDAEMHADLETLLLQEGSLQKNLWGFNLYPEMDGDDFIEFDSLINIRPNQGNRSRDVEDPAIREQIIEIINSLCK